MKKFWLAGIVTLMLTLGSIAAFSSNNSPTYTPMIDGYCVEYYWPFERTPLILTCIPGGNQACSIGTCNGWWLPF